VVVTAKLMFAGWREQINEVANQVIWICRLLQTLKCLRRLHTLTFHKTSTNFATVSFYDRQLSSHRSSLLSRFNFLGPTSARFLTGNSEIIARLWLTRGYLLTVCGWTQHQICLLTWKPCNTCARFQPVVYRPLSHVQVQGLSYCNSCVNTTELRADCKNAGQWLSLLNQLV